MKCPCENCITLSMCKNLYPNDKIINSMNAINKCSLLYDYLNVRQLRISSSEIFSDLEHEIMVKRMKILNEFIPWKKE